MSRNVAAADKADETVTVRVPRGTADKIRAATGQPFSTIVRWMCVQLLYNFADSDGNQREQLRETLQRQTSENLDASR